MWPAFLALALIVAPIPSISGPAVAVQATAGCEIPAVAGSELPNGSASPVATPAASVSIIKIEGEARRSATPASLPVATPLATPLAAPSPDPEAALTAELTAVSEALAACLSEGDAEMVTQLAGERFLGQLFGSSVPMSRDDYRSFAGALAPIPERIVDLREAQQTADDQATAVVTRVVGNQLMRYEWVFARAPRDERPAGSSDWLVASERPLTVEAPRRAAPVEVTIDASTFSLDVDSVEGPDVVMRGRNNADEDHEMLVLRYENGFTSADLLRATGPALPEDVTFVGEMPVRAGDEAELVLVDLEPGVYTIVCLFPNMDGVPFLADGMEATLTVE